MTRRRAGLVCLFGYLSDRARCLERKIVEPSLFVQTIFGSLGGDRVGF